VGKGYTFNDTSGPRATTKATRFIRDVGKTHNRRASIVATLQNKRDDSWACTVDVCGPSNVKIDQLFEKHKHE